MRALMLTVGTNPLPCAVAYLAHCAAGGPPDRVLLFGSDSVGEPMERLRRFIETRPPGQTRSSGLRIQMAKVADPWDPAELWTTATAAIETVTHGGHPVELQLNYTGGTKMMAVHVHRAAREAHIAGMDRSYIDPRAFKLRRDDQGVYPGTGDLRALVHISIDDLLNLHSLRRLDHRAGLLWGGTAEVLWAAVKGVGNLHDRDQPLYRYARWIEGQKKRRDFVNGPARAWRSLDLRTAAVPGLADQFVPDLANAGYAGMSPEGVLGWRQMHRRGQPVSPADVGTILKFLDGGWLESVAERRLRDSVGRVDPAVDVAGGVEVAFTTRPRPSAELDLLVVRGYQLTAISVTRSLDRTDIGTIKQHAFEVVHRASQLGGDEARAVLVVVDAPNGQQAQRLETDLRTFTGTGAHLRVVPHWWLDDRDKMDALLKDWD